MRWGLPIHVRKGVLVACLWPWRFNYACFTATPQPFAALTDYNLYLSIAFVMSHTKSGLTKYIKTQEDIWTETYPTVRLKEDMHHKYSINNLNLNMK